MDYDFQADIGANIRDFQQEMREVDAIIRETALGADAMIGADLTEFQRRMQESERTLEELRNGADAEIGADTSEFMRETATVEAVTQAISTGENDVEIGADIASAMAGIAVVEAATEALERDTIWVRIRSSWRNYQSTMGAIATFSRSFGEITAMTSRGIMISLSPAIVPILGSVVSLIGNLGPMVGTLAGSTFALASAFGTAGIGAAAFGSIAVTNLKGIFGASEELKKLQEKLGKADDSEARAKILADIEQVQGSLNKEQKKGLSAMNDLSDTWSGIAGSLQTETVNIFVKALRALETMLTRLKPLFSTVMDAASGLMDSLSASLNGKSMRLFFEYLNTTAAPMLETITKAVGNFFLGFLNMMTAFGPLAQETAAGFGDMAERFAEWTAGLSESKKFQSFVDYVSENMPKIRNIFGDAFKGIINTFAAFAPSSADMMTSLEDMMARFKEWSSTLKENQGFQEFMDYLKETGPKVVELLGNLRDVFWEIAQALAPAGESIIDVANKILEFTANLIDNNPWIGKLIAAVVVLGGAFLAVLPHIVLMQAAFGGVIGRMILMTVKTIWAAGVQVAKWIWMGTMATLNAIKVAAAWTLATGKAMVLAVAKMIASAAVFVARWVWMGAQSLIQAARMAAAWFIALGPVGWVTGIIVGLAILIIANWDKISAWTKKTWTTVSSAVSTAVQFIMSWVETKFPALYAVIQSYMTMAREVISTVWEFIKGTFKNVLAFLKSLVTGDFKGMKQAISDQMELAKSTISRIWDAVKSYLSTLLGTLLTKFQEMFGKIVTKVKEKMGEAVENVSEKVGEMPGKVLGFVSDMVSAGADLIQGLIDGAVGMASSAISSVTDIAGNMVDAALSFFKIKSPSRVFMEMGAYLSEGLAVGVKDKAKSAISSVESVARGMTNAFNPQLAMADMRANAQLNTSVSRKDMGVVRHAFAAEVGQVEKHEPELYLVVDGKELGKVVAKPVQEENERRGEMVRVGRGR